MSPANSSFPHRVLAGALVALALALPARAEAGEAFYLLLFGSQQTPNDPNYSHSFATFVRLTWPGDRPCPGGARLEAHTISWLPRTMQVRTLALCPEEGFNFDLHTTIRYALANEERVSLWGPYPIEPDLYARALRRIAQLRSGEVRYKANDAGYNTDCVTNCIHAIAAIAERLRVRVASPGWGEVASYAILQQLKPWVLDLDHPCYEVSSALGLDAYPIIYRDGRTPPLSGAVLGRIRRLCGKECVCPSYGPPR